MKIQGCLILKLCIKPNLRIFVERINEIEKEFNINNDEKESVNSICAYGVWKCHGVYQSYRW